MSQRLGAIVVGFGHLGNFHAQKYAGLTELAELVALIDPRAEEMRAKADKIRAGLPIFSSIKEYFSAVEAGKVARAQLASVATTTEHHLSASLELLKEKVHLLVEKPLASTSAEGRQLVEAADKAGCVLATGQVERHRATEALRLWNAKPLFIECHRLSPFPARSVDIDVIFDLMIHDIDLMLAMVDSPLKSIHAAGFPVLTSQIDIANCRFEFENGCVANLTSSRISLTKVRKFRIFSGDAYLSMDLQSGNFERYGRNTGEMDLAKAISHEAGTLSVEDALQEEIRDFVAAVREGKSPLVSGRDGLRAIEIAEKVVKDVKERVAKLGPTLPTHGLI
jgi:predicted dehydrogenase